MIRKQLWLCTILVAVVAASGATGVQAAQAASSKVQICHIPPGNPANFHTITVSQNALPAHLAHGDLSGSCSAHAEQLCNDGNACTIDAMNPQTETCLTSHPPVNCDDSLLCTTDSCNPASGCQYAPIVCNDQNNCTVDACNPSNGQCTGTQIDCGTLGVCLTATGECDFPCDGVSCEPIDSCHAAGQCVLSGGQAECADGPALDDGTACNDGNNCLTSDVCQGGTCVGSNPVVCTAIDACHVAGTCDPLTGSCSNPDAPNGTACSDGDACTQTDTCEAGSCTGANSVVCATPDQCHDAGTCDPATGECSNPAKADGTACIDGNACTHVDTCQLGACVGSSPAPCAALDQCHVAGTCNPSTGQCSNPDAANGTACNDGNAGTTGDKCTAGVCAGTSGRFTDLENGTVRDNLTGLIWLKNPTCLGQQFWQDGIRAVAQLGQGTSGGNACGLTDGSQPGDWRLPTLHCNGTNEVCDQITAGTGTFPSIFGPSCATRPYVLNTAGTGCWTEGNVFSGLFPADLYNYWSSTISRWNSQYAESVDIYDGRITSNYQGSRKFVWAVRGQTNPVVQCTFTNVVACDINPL